MNNIRINPLYCIKEKCTHYIENYPYHMEEPCCYIAGEFMKLTIMNVE